MKIVPTVLASCSLILAIVSLAGAFSFEEDGRGHPLRWKRPTVTYRMVLANNPDGANGEAAVRRAFASWNTVSSNVNLVFDGYEPFGVQQYDRKNMVYWEYENWAFDSRLAAVTFHYYDTRDGRLLDADIVFNAQWFDWAIGGGGYDIGNSATHEVGHFLGLGHSKDSSATMYLMVAPGETWKRSLAAGDVAGLEALYGSSGKERRNRGVGEVASAVNGTFGGVVCPVSTVADEVPSVAGFLTRSEEQGVLSAKYCR